MLWAACPNPEAMRRCWSVVAAHPRNRHRDAPTNSAQGAAAHRVEISLQLSGSFDRGNALRLGGVRAGGGLLGQSLQTDNFCLALGGSFGVLLLRSPTHGAIPQSSPVSRHTRSA